MLGFLYFFQVLFLNTYYKLNQSNNLDQTINSIQNNIDKNNASTYFDNLSLNNEVCIQIISNNNLVYSSDFYKHCANKDNEILTNIQSTFINSNKKNLKVEFINNAFHNKSLVYGKKIGTDTYVFANSSLEPIDKSISLLKSQFIYVTLVTLLLAFIISYFISKKLADPIIKINKNAKKLVKKEYDINFSTDSEIYEIKELEDTLNKTTKELAKTETLRKEFLANIGHDLKTPLTMIEAYAASARDLNYNKKIKRERDLNIIIDESERLNMLVNDILLLSKIQSKTIELKKEVFNITELIKEILKRFAIYENDGYIFEFKTKKQHLIEADKKSIERVIYNLIINAINYTGKDKKVYITIKEINTITINVTDNGVGISEEDKKLVWNKYYQTNKRHKRTEIGTGLGLSIVKSILEDHKFEYGIKSKINKGTTFYFKCNIKEK